MNSRWQFLRNRIGEQLWVKPLLMCVLSVIGALLASAADHLGLSDWVPSITARSIETLLSIIAASMLVIATFAVGSMVSAYASASSTATPRCFRLVVADDVSQNALSAFLAAFIFSIVAIVALQNAVYDKAGRFTLFVLTLLAFALVIVTFVRWVDRIARLGRMGTTIDNVEAATRRALLERRRAPTLGGVSVAGRAAGARAVCAPSVGFVQRVDMPALQQWAEAANARVEVAALPGAFVAPCRALAYVDGAADNAETDADIAAAFVLGDERTFDEDPRFGLVVLSEIASRALSPAVNDSGTAIDVIGTQLRLFTAWCQALSDRPDEPPRYDRVAVPEVSEQDMLDDAFRAIARDGAGNLDAVLWLLKALGMLVALADECLRELARQHIAQTLARAEQALSQPSELALVRRCAREAADGYRC